MTKQTLLKALPTLKRLPIGALAKKHNLAESTVKREVENFRRHLTKATKASIDSKKIGKGPEGYGYHEELVENKAQIFRNSKVNCVRRIMVKNEGASDIVIRRKVDAELKRRNLAPLSDLMYGRILETVKNDIDNGVVTPV